MKKKLACLICSGVMLMSMFPVSVAAQNTTAPSLAVSSIDVDPDVKLIKVEPRGQLTFQKTCTMFDNRRNAVLKVAFYYTCSDTSMGLQIIGVDTNTRNIDISFVKPNAGIAGYEYTGPSNVKCTSSIGGSSATLYLTCDLVFNGEKVTKTFSHLFYAPKG